MRGLILGAAVALVFGVGCQQSRTDAGDVQAQREEVMQERQDLQEQQAQAQQDVQEQYSEAQQDADSEVQSEREDVAKAEEEFAQTQQEHQQTQAEEQVKAEEEQQEAAVGGSGSEGTQSLSGKVDAKKADELTLKTDAGEKKLVITPDTQFTWNGKDVKVDEVPKGAEVRASFKLEGQSHVANKVEVLSAPKK